MNDVYLSLADGFDKLAAGYRALAGTADQSEPAPAQQEARKTEITDEVAKEAEAELIRGVEAADQSDESEETPTPDVEDPENAN